MSQGFDVFSDDVRFAVEGLEALGYLTDTVEQWGHSWTLRTLKGDEELAAAVVTKEYVETLGQAKAWAWANVALAIDAVDGNGEFCPPAGPDLIEFARARFRYCTRKWYWPIGEFLFGEFVKLQRKQIDALEAVQDFPRRSQTTSPPESGSLSDLGISPEDLAPEAA